MVYVARFTNDPEDDIQRGWSGWMSADWKSIQDAADFFGIEYPEGADDDTLLALLERDHRDIRLDARLNLYRDVHHDGLSCYTLDADTLQGAILEAQTTRGIAWVGWGDRTIGKVTFHCAVPGREDLYIFECEDTCGEN